MNYALGEVLKSSEARNIISNSDEADNAQWIEINHKDHTAFAMVIWQMLDGHSSSNMICRDRARFMVDAMNICESAQDMEHFSTYNLKELVIALETALEYIELFAGKKSGGIQFLIRNVLNKSE